MDPIPRDELAIMGQSRLGTAHELPHLTEGEHAYEPSHFQRQYTYCFRGVSHFAFVFTYVSDIQIDATLLSA
jgi:hypothetical protein